MTEKVANTMTEVEAEEAMAKLLGIDPGAVRAAWDSTGGGLDGSRTIEVRIGDDFFIRAKGYAYQEIIERVMKFSFGASAKQITAVQKKLLELNDSLDSLWFDLDDKGEG